MERAIETFERRNSPVNVSWDALGNMHNVIMYAMEQRVPPISGSFEYNGNNVSLRFNYKGDKI